MLVTPQTEALRKDLAQAWKIEPFRVEVEFSNGALLITIDGKVPSDEQMQAFHHHVRLKAAERRREMN